MEYSYQGPCRPCLKSLYFKELPRSSRSINQSINFQWPVALHARGCPETEYPVQNRHMYLYICIETWSCFSPFIYIYMHINVRIYIYIYIHISNIDRYMDEYRFIDFGIGLGFLIPRGRRHLSLAILMKRRMII